MTTLGTAAKTGNIAELNRLLSIGDDPTIPSPDHSPLILARFNGQKEIVALLKEHTKMCKQLCHNPTKLINEYTPKRCYNFYLKLYIDTQYFSDLKNAKNVFKCCSHILTKYKRQRLTETPGTVSYEKMNKDSIRISLLNLLISSLHLSLKLPCFMKLSLYKQEKILRTEIHPFMEKRSKKMLMDFKARIRKQVLSFVLSAKRYAQRNPANPRLHLDAIASILYFLFPRRVHGTLVFTDKKTPVRKLIAATNLPIELCGIKHRGVLSLKAYGALPLKL